MTYLYKIVYDHDYSGKEVSMYVISDENMVHAIDYFNKVTEGAYDIISCTWMKEFDGILVDDILYKK